VRDEDPYSVGVEDGNHGVIDEEGRLVCACGTETNARHYMVLLNQAWRRGYKAGYRDGKSAGKR
jgi:hypothetical protein